MKYDPGALARQVFHEAKMHKAYEWMGAHKANENSVDGVRFTIWAPHAKKVSLVADCNNWDKEVNPMQRLTEDETLWSVFIPNIVDKMNYQFAILGSDDEWRYKADPYAYESALRPNTASQVNLQPSYQWQDKVWQKNKKCDETCALPPLADKKMNIYEVHLGSWRQHEDGSFYSYRELADTLIPYVKSMGFTHIELLPIMEHPLDASWGYQVTGYFAPTSRYGRPNDLKYFIDKAHQANIGVFLDWVPAHFCKDDHGLRLLDGKPTYEYDSEERAENRGWGTLHFDLSRGEVVSFLVSNAVYWLKEFHFDGLRVDAVASMLYLDYDKKAGEWSPNRYGGRENIESIDFLRYLNKIVHEVEPRAIMMAEESTAWPKVTEKEEHGGLGFDYKWNMGWMNDSLRYIETDPLFRKGVHDLLTFPITYAFSEKFILPLSHDEVVHGKHSYLDKMPGDYWQQFANLRLFYGYWMSQPGKKLLFMGSEFGQYIEWNEAQELDWSLLEYEKHAQMQDYVRKLNEKVVFAEGDCNWERYQWMDCNNKDQSIISYVRYGQNGNHDLIICNFTPQTYENYKVPVPAEGVYEEYLNSDDVKYGGSGVVNSSVCKTIEQAWNGQEQYITVKVAPLAVMMFKYQAKSCRKIKEISSSTAKIYK